MGTRRVCKLGKQGGSPLLRPSLTALEPASADVRANAARALWVVAIVALLINALSLSASQLWAWPDSLRYVQMAADIAERFDFSSDSFLVRTPGYPALLAGIFLLFGSKSPAAILAVQHAMVAATALLIALTGWHLTRRPAVALVSGILCAGSLQVLAFANLLMSEVPYMLALIASSYFLVKYHRVGRLRLLALASLMVGVSYLFRPTGLTVLALCVVAGIHRVWIPVARVALSNNVSPRGPKPAARRGRPVSRLVRISGAVTVAIVPALAVVLPCVIQNTRAHGGQLLSHSLGLALYHRTARFDRLDSPDSEALKEIHKVVGEAKRLGCLGPNADISSWGTVCEAYRCARNASHAQAGETISRAAWDLVWEHPRLIADRTARYAAWMLMVPDSTYRFQPGGAKGSGCKRAEDAEIFDIGTYQSDPEPYGDALRKFAGYIPLTAEPRFATPVWTAIARGFYRHVETGPSIRWLCDSPYEAFVLLCALGAVGSLLTRQRTTWMLVGGVIVLQVVGSAFLGGPTPRYGVPVHPLMNLYAAWVLVGAIGPCVRRTSA